MTYKRETRFKRGSGAYICSDCGKRTRETGECESDFGLCAACFRVAGEENEHSDGACGDDCLYCARDKGIVDDCRSDGCSNPAELDAVLCYPCQLKEIKARKKGKQS